MRCFKRNPFWNPSAVPEEQRSKAWIKGVRLRRRKKKQKIMRTAKFWKRNPEYRAFRDAVFRRDKYTCRYCGKGGQGVRLELDHVIPKWIGGRNDMANCVTACVDCNQAKGGSTRGWEPKPI